MATDCDHVPCEMDFLEAFGIEAEVAEPSDGFWRYRFVFQDGLTLVLSFDAHQSSLQTVILAAEDEVSTVVHENLEALEIEVAHGRPRLVGTCRCDEQTTKMIVEIYPRLCVNWSSLRT